MHWTTVSIFAALFLLVTVLGFIASRWRRGDLDTLDEWGLAGRQFGTVVTWFLLGGDLYTAYTFIAVPAFVFGAGAIGFFAVPYTALMYPFLFFVFPRMWSVAHKHGYITASDFVAGRFGSRSLAVAVAMTGIVATMPYIALQLVGIEVVLAAMGFTTTGVLGHMPLVMAFIILAAYTYNSGLRAPALIALVKDLLIYITVIAAIVVIPMNLGGYAEIVRAVPPDRLLLQPPAAGHAGQYSAYVTLVIGSTLALFLYPHSMTGLLSASSRNVIKRNAALLPTYSIALALLACLGYMAIAAGVSSKPEHAAGFERYGANYAVPALYLDQFSDWFVGVAFAAIAIGALVPAAIMSIAAANLYTRNIYRDLFNRSLSGKAEATSAKRASLVVKFGALAFIVFLPMRYAIQLQLLGGVWIIQTFPAVILGLFTRWFHGRALTIGLVTGLAVGTAMVASLNFTSSTYPLHIGSTTIPGYAALYSLIVNLVVTTVATVVMRAMGASMPPDQTAPDDYHGGPETDQALGARR